MKMEKQNAVDEEDCCPICHGSFNVPCRTSCSHCFCGDCIVRVWLHGDVFQRCKCPMCCRAITSLTPLDAHESTNDPTAVKIMANVARYNRLHIGGLNGVIQKIRNLPFFTWRMIEDMLDNNSRSRIIKARFPAIILSMIYMLCPADFIPADKREILNLLDNIVLAFVCFTHIAGLNCFRRLIGRAST